jgi:hypothetical protein
MHRDRVGITLPEAEHDAVEDAERRLDDAVRLHLLDQLTQRLRHFGIVGRLDSSYPSLPGRLPAPWNPGPPDKVGPLGSTPQQGYACATTVQGR